MDSEIVYCADEKYLERLSGLRRRTSEILNTPFSSEDYRKAENVLKEAEHYFSSAVLSEDNEALWESAGGVIYFLENAILMLNKQYFHYGNKRAYEEINAMKNIPEKFT